MRINMVQMINHRDNGYQLPPSTTRGQDNKKRKTRLKINLKLNLLEHTKLRHFWAQIASWAPRRAQKMFIAYMLSLRNANAGDFSV